MGSELLATVDEAWSYHLHLKAKTIRDPQLWQENLGQHTIPRKECPYRVNYWEIIELHNKNLHKIPQLSETSRFLVESPEIPKPQEPPMS